MNCGYWDIHNHLLPGIDDGSSCMEETMQLIRTEYEQGVYNIVFTPHYRPGMFQIKPEDREAVFHSVCEIAQRKYPEMHFYLGCEYFVHNYMMANLRDTRCRMAGTEYLLMEFPTNGHFSYMHNVISRLIKVGYKPIIAHIERCMCLTIDSDRVKMLKDLGALLQVNADSVLGKSGITKKRFCNEVLKQELVDFIASDGHNMEHRTVHMEECIKKVEKKFGSQYTEDLFRKNPARIFEK